MLRKIQNNLSGYFALKQEEHSCPLVKYGPCIVTAFPEVPYGKRDGEEELHTGGGGSLTDKTSSRGSRSAPTVVNHVNSMYH